MLITDDLHKEVAQLSRRAASVESSRSSLIGQSVTSVSLNPLVRAWIVNPDLAEAFFCSLRPGAKM